MVKIQLQIDFGTNFDFTYKWLDQKPVRTKIGEKWLICSKQSLKNDKQKNFPHKIQNAHSMWFPHRFSILGPKVTPKGPPDDHGLPRLGNGLASGLLDFLAWIFFSGNLYAYTHMCQHVLLSCDQLIFKKTVLTYGTLQHFLPIFFGGTPLRAVGILPEILLQVKSATTW